jgi:hypothetical protein
LQRKNTRRNAVAVVPKGPLVAVSSLLPAHWVPLGEVFARSKAALGSDGLTELGLRQHALAGRLIFGARRILRNSAEACFVIKPEYWEQSGIDRPIPDIGRTQPVVRSVFAFLRLGQWYFFVRRRVLDKLYPVAGAAPPSPPKPPTRLRRRSSEQELIRQLAAKEWPGGYGRIKTNRIIEVVGKRFKAMGEPVPGRDAFERALAAARADRLGAAGTSAAER